MRFFLLLWLVSCGARSELDVPPEASTCPPAVSVCTRAVLASGMKAYALVIDDRYVYFATDEYVARVAKAGGDVTKLDSNGGSALAIDGGELFMSTKGAVRRAATVCDAQPSTVLSTSAHDPAAIAADATNVYVVDLYDLALVKINRANGLATKLLDLEHPVALVLSQGSLFLSDWDKGIERLSLDGAVLNADLVGAHAGFFAVSGSTIVTDAWDGVYYASWPSGSFGGEIAETTSAGGIAVDGSTVYFVDGAGVWRAPFASNGAKLIAPDLGGAFIAVDDACVYYATNDRIVRTPK